MHWNHGRMRSARLGLLGVSALLPTFCIAFSTSAVCAQGQDDWERSTEAQSFELKQKAVLAELVRINGNGTDQKLKTELLAMRKTGQDTRAEMFALPNAKHSILGPELEHTDAALTEELKQIVVSHGWPTIALVGLETSRAAALILIHSPDHGFQRHLLPELQGLVQERRIVGSDIAMLVDKMLVAEGKPQRFGTQFAAKANGPWVMDPVEDPAHLD